MARLDSLDTVRGIDMFLLVAVERIVVAIAETFPEVPLLSVARAQFTHPSWEGFTLYDLIFPLFEFSIGASVFLSLRKRLNQGDTKASIIKHGLVRVMWMVLIGMTINGNLLSWQPSQMRLTYSVLQMLAVSYLICVLAMVFLEQAGQVVLFLSLLLGYWALLTFVPLPAEPREYINWMGQTVRAEPHRVGQYVEGSLVNYWLDDIIFGDWDRWRVGWILESMAHGCSGLMGLLAMRLLKNESLNWQKRTAWCLGFGVASLSAGWLWSYQFPIIKNLWSSTFVLWAGGWSLVLMGSMFAIVDGLNWKRWTYPFLVIGSNSLLAYLMVTVLSPVVHSAVSLLVGGSAKLFGPSYAIFYAVSWASFVWCALWILYRNKIFLRL
jgi:predicted acyltransferase